MSLLVTQLNPKADSRDVAVFLTATSTGRPTARLPSVLALAAAARSGSDTAPPRPPPLPLPTGLPPPSRQRRGTTGGSGFRGGGAGGGGPRRRAMGRAAGDGRVSAALGGAGGAEGRRRRRGRCAALAERPPPLAAGWAPRRPPASSSSPSPPSPSRTSSTAWRPAAGEAGGGGCEGSGLLRWGEPRRGAARRVFLAAARGARAAAAAGLSGPGRRSGGRAGAEPPRERCERPRSPAPLRGTAADAALHPLPAELTATRVLQLRCTHICPVFVRLCRLCSFLICLLLARNPLIPFGFSLLEKCWLRWHGANVCFKLINHSSESLR